MNNPETRYFFIAELYIKLTFLDPKVNNMKLIPSFFPFMCAPVPEEDLTLSIIVDDTLQPIKKENRERIRAFETGNGEIVVDMLMLCFAISASYHNAILVHSSLVRQNGYGYAFHASSGTGKSTQVSMWLRHLPGCDLMNDDNPIIRIIDGIPYIFGSPWSGKTPCYRPIKARLGAMTRIDRDDHNWVEKLSPIEGFTSVLASTNSLKWDVPVFRNVGDTVSKIAETTGCYILHCLPNREAAEVCNAAIAVKS